MNRWVETLNQKELLEGRFWAEGLNGHGVIGEIEGRG